MEVAFDMDTQNNGCPVSSIALAFLSGALIGAGAALLLAPQSGVKTLRMLKNYGREAEATVQEAKATLDSAIELGRQFIKDKKTVLTAAFEAGREAMNKERA